MSLGQHSSDTAARAREPTCRVPIVTAMRELVNASSKLTLLARLGFAARGLLYIVIGVLVIGTGRNEDPAGALQYLGEGTGRPLLFVMVAGLIGYGVWRLADAFLNLEGHGDGRKGAVERLGAAVSGLVHLLLAWQAVRLIQGARSTGNGSEDSAQAALQLPAGDVLLIIVGVALTGIGVLQLVKAWKATFLHHLDHSVANRPWALWSGRAGYAARGLVFMIIGYFVARAGAERRASEAGGMEQALSWLSSPIDVVMAVGLFCFGVFSLIEARYRILHNVPVDGVARRIVGRWTGVFPPMIRIRKAGPLGLAAVLSIQACGAPPEARGAIVSDSDRAYGRQAHAQLLAEFGGAYPGTHAAYVRTVGERIARAAGLEGQCTFTLVNSDVVNAFAVPGCYIYATRGLVAIVNSEAELASVLGHELGHIVARHAQRQQRRSVWQTLGVIAVSVTGSERLTRLASQAGQLFGLRYSRQQEYEADDFGITYLKTAGYDVYEAADMLGSLQRNSDFLARTGGRDEAQTVPEWALSHPLTERRVARAHQAAQKSGLKDDELPEGISPYLSQVDGLLFGDDPEQGFVTGRRFAHPRMRIAFEAPQGFSLTNSPQAIRLTGPDDVSGEFAGGALGRTDLASYASALLARIVGETPVEIQRTTPTRINGLDAILLDVRVTMQDTSVPLAIAVYDGGDGQAYHFIIASRPSDGAAQPIETLFRSFRRLSPTEAGALRPRFVRTVGVTAGDTPDTLARRVIDPSPRALFDLLNAVEAGQSFGAARRVKIVTDSR